MAETSSVSSTEPHGTSPMGVLDIGGKLITY